MTAVEPPVRGDHRSTWRWLLFLSFLFLASVVCALLVSQGL